MPLRLQVTDLARNQLDDTVTWLQSYSEDAAQRFVVRLEESLGELCERVAIDLEQKSPLHPDELGSLYYSRPVFVFLLRTGKTHKRRSSAGVWRLYYDLVDSDQGRQPDTLRFLSIYHAAARPLWEESGADD